MRTHAPTRAPRSSSASTSRSADSGAKRSTAGKRRSRATRPTPRRTTNWPSATRTRASSTRRGNRTSRPSSSRRTTCRSSRTTSSSRKSMTAVANRKRNRSLAAVALLALASAGCGVSYFEIPIETPIQPKLDVTSFQRVLIAGFVAGGTEDVDANQETVRLLRSQLRSKSSLRVIDADVMELRDVAQDQNKTASAPEATGDSLPPNELERASQPLPLPDDIKNEKDLEAYERLFANTAYWRRIGEEYQNP